MHFYLLAYIICFGVLRIIVSKSLLRREISFYSDEMAHSALTNIIKSKKHHKDYFKRIFFNSPALGYPTFLHSLLISLGLDGKVYVKRLFSMIISFLSPVIFFLIFQNTFPMESIMLSIAYLLFSLAHFGFNGITTVSFTPRPFADFLLLCFYSLFVVNIEIMNYGIVFLLVLIAVIIFFTSKFGIQSIILTSLLYSLLTFDFIIIYIIAFAYLIAVLVNFRRLKEINSAHFYHLSWYFKNYKWAFPKMKINFSDKRKFYDSILKNPPLGMLLQFIPTFPIMIALIFYSDIDFVIKALFLSTSLISVLTIIRPFVAIGPSFRYSHIVYPFMILYVLSSNPELTNLIIYWIIAESILSFAIFYMLYFNKKEKHDLKSEYLKIIDSFEFKNKNIATSPTRISLAHFGVKDSLDIRFFDTAFFSKDGVKTFEKYLDVYPFLTTKKEIIIDFIHRFDIDYIILDKHILKSKYGEYEMYDEYGFNYLETERFKIIKFKK